MAMLGAYNIHSMLSKEASVVKWDKFEVVEEKSQSK